MSGREYALRFQTAQEIGAARLARGSADVGKNIEAQRIVRDGSIGRNIERPVSILVPNLQRFDADALDGYADPSVAGANQVVVNLIPIDIEIVTAGDVVPLDDDGAVELLEIGWTADQEP